MGEIRDFVCTYDNSAGIVPQLVGKLGLSIPEAYCRTECMVRLSKALQQEENQPFCVLPFCHTLEGEAYGGIVNFGDETFGPRAKGYICESLQEVLELPPMDLTRGRVEATLKAAEMLVDEGKEVVLMLSGPFTILNVLMDSAKIFRGMRREPELAVQVFNKMGEDLLRLVEAAQNRGVRLFSYADSAGSVKIIGPKMAEWVVEEFTYGFMKKLEKKAEPDTLIMLCPKTAYALTGMERAEFVPHKMPEHMTYNEACVEMRRRVTFTGQTCMKNSRHLLKSGVLQEIRLL